MNNLLGGTCFPQEDIFSTVVFGNLRLIVHQLLPLMTIDNYSDMPKH